MLPNTSQLTTCRSFDIEERKRRESRTVKEKQHAAKKETSGSIGIAFPLSQRASLALCDA